MEEEEERNQENQEESAKKEDESKAEAVMRIAVEKKELVASYVALRRIGDDDARACEKELRKWAGECDELLQSSGVEGYFVKKTPQSYCAKPTGLLEVVVDESVAIGYKAEEFWGDKFVDVFPSLEGCCEFFRVPKSGEHGRLFSTMEAYCSQWAAANRVSYEGSSGGFVHNAFYLSKRMGEEYKESALVARRPMMVVPKDGDVQVEVPFETIVELVNESVPAFKAAPTFEVKDGEVHLTKFAVDALFGTAWEGHDTKLLSTETVAERRSFYVLAEGYSGADFKVGREMHSLLRSAFGGIDGVAGWLPGHGRGRE